MFFIFNAHTRHLVLNRGRFIFLSPRIGAWRDINWLVGGGVIIFLFSYVFGGVNDGLAKILGRKMVMDWAIGAEFDSGRWFGRVERTGIHLLVFAV